MGEVIPNTFPSLFWGYNVIWLILGSYILFLGYKINSLEKKLCGNKNQEDSA